MKKIIQLICIGLIIITASCNKASNEVNPTSILGILSLMGNSSLTVKVTYTGALDTYGPQPGTQRIFVYLYRTMGSTTRDPEPLYTGSTSAATTGAEETIKINGIVDGKYYMLIFYDYSKGGNDDNQRDRYILYNNTPYPSVASTVTVKGDTVLDPISFGDANQLLASSAYLSATGHTLTLQAQYNGTEGTGDKKIHVYLYNALGDTVTENAPYKMAVTSSAVEIGKKYSFAFNSVAAGNYYILAFYDYSTTGTDTPGQENDRYILYNGKKYIDEADTVDVSANTNIATTIAFGDVASEYTLGAGGAFMSNYGTVTVPVHFTGTDSVTPGAGHVYVNLYDQPLGADPMTPTPKYSGVSSAVVMSGATANIEISVPVHFGSYYMSVFYDADGMSDASLDDPYIIYNASQYIGSAGQVTVDSNLDTLGTVNLDDSYLLNAGGAYDVQLFTYTLNVPVRYTGTAATSGGTGDQIIHVSLYNTLGANTTTPAPPVYTGVTGAVSVGEDATVTVTGVPAGTYKMLVFYDYNSSGATSGILGDRYVFYGNSGATTGATDLIISGNTTIPDGSRIIFGDSYRLKTGGAYMTGGTLTVHATYTGTDSLAASQIYVYLYSTTGWPGTTSRTPAKVYSASTTGTAAINTQYNIDVNGVTAGNYYVLVFYNYQVGGTADSTNDRYWLYPGTCATASATLLSVPFDHTELTVSFGDAWILQSTPANNSWLTGVCP